MSGARLVLLNGAPGIGKSTVARAFAAANPRTLNLDIDLLRTLVGGWQADFEGAGEVVRPLALGLAAIHLSAGMPVIVPQYLSSSSEVASLRKVAADTGSEFCEVVLTTKFDDALARYRECADSGDELRAVISANIDREGGVQHLRDLFDRLEHGVAQGLTPPESRADAETLAGLWPC